MNRRQLLSTLAIPLVIAAPKSLADSSGVVPYTREAYEQALASGEPFMLDFFAPW